MANHLSYDDRMEIEMLLKTGACISEISRRLNRHKSTITREITLRSTSEKKGSYGHSFNACIHRYDCDLKSLCSKKECIGRNKSNHKSCKFCGYCNDNCEYFKEEVCTKLKLPPYVCNGCKDRNKCTLKKFIYSAKKAQKDYEDLLIESRKGISFTIEEVKRLDDIIKPLGVCTINHVFLFEGQRHFIF